jgi:DNA-binding transcriptional regulator YiaG
MITRASEWTEPGTQSWGLKNRHGQSVGRKRAVELYPGGPTDTTSFVWLERSPEVSYETLAKAVYQWRFLADQTSSCLMLIRPEISTSETVRSVHSRSGLTWAELATIFGVSRRSLHNWASGARLNARNASRLERISRVVEALEAETPEQARQQLVAARPNALSLYQDLVRERLGEDSGDSFAPSELLASAGDELPHYLQPDE